MSTMTTIYWRWIELNGVQFQFCMCTFRFENKLFVFWRFFLSWKRKSCSSSTCSHFTVRVHLILMDHTCLLLLFRVRPTVRFAGNCFILHSNYTFLIHNRRFESDHRYFLTQINVKRFYFGAVRTWRQFVDWVNHESRHRLPIKTHSSNLSGSSGFNGTLLICWKNNLY